MDSENSKEEETMLDAAHPENKNETKDSEIISEPENYIKGAENSKEDDSEVKSDHSENKKEMKNPEIIPETEKPNPSSESTNEENAYLEHITYDSEGVAFYIDPHTSCKYKWSSEENSWVTVDASEKEMENIHENEFYKWCHEKNEWIPKSNPSEEFPKDQLETENSTKKSEIPKEKDQRNVTYSADDGTYTYTDTDGTIFFWDTEKSAWFPKIDDDFIAMYQLNYGNNAELSTKKDSEETVNEHLPEKVEESSSVTANTPNVNTNTLKRKLPAEPPKWFDIPTEQNTKVYVDKLPLDITEDEFVEIMSKCGMVMRDPNTRKYKVKIYTEPNGQPKGDGLCDYIKIESVDLALNLLDGYDVRGHKISVQRAKFQMRGDYNPALKPKIKKKEKEKIQKMKEKLFDWRPEKVKGQRSKHERVVVIKNLFTPDIFDKDVQLIIEYQNDLKEECTKCGTVRKVVLYDQHPEGVAQITMSCPEEADVVVSMMNGRYFGKRQLTAEIWDGKNKYKNPGQDTDASKRSATWNQFLGDEEKKEPEKVAEKPQPELTPVQN